MPLCQSCEQRPGRIERTFYNETPWNNGPECSISQLRQVSQRPPVWLVVCACGRWSRRIVGTEDKAKQAHVHHKNLHLPMMLDGEPVSVREAIAALRAVGLEPELVDEEDRPAEDESEETSDRSGSDIGR